MTQRIIVMMLAAFVVSLNSKLLAEPSDSDDNHASIKEDPTMNVDGILKTADSLLYEGRLDKADDLLGDRIGSLDSVPGSEVAALRLKVKQGMVLSTHSFITNQDYDRALAINLQAVEEAKAMGEERLEADALTFAGLASYARTFNSGGKDYEAALSLYERGSEIRHRHDDRRGMAESNIYLGIIRERNGDLDGARALYNEALKISVDGGYKLEESYATRHLAFIRQREDDLAGALDYFQRSLTLREEIGYKVYLPFSYLSVGTVYDSMDKLDEALPFYIKSYESAKAVNAPRAVVLAALNIGEVYKKQEKFDKARAYYEEAFAVAGELGYEKGQAYATAGLKEIDSLSAK